MAIAQSEFSIILMTVLMIYHRQRNGLASGGPKGHGAELMINIAIVSMHAILYI